MIHIRVITHNGIPPIQPLSMTFDELGGNIGRAGNNTLVLDDPGRSISRIHASISFREGHYYIHALGSAIPVYLNDQPISNGQDMPIAAGDKIGIGDYVMEVFGENPSSWSDESGTSPKHHLSAASNSSSDSNSLDDLFAFSPGNPSQNPFSSKKRMQDANPLIDLDPFASKADSDASEMIPPDFNPFVELSSDLDQLPAKASANPALADELKPILEPKEKLPGIDDIFNPTHSILDLPDTPSVDAVDPLIAIDSSLSHKASARPVLHDNASELRASLPPMNNRKDFIKGSSAGVNKTVATNSVSGHEELLQAFLNGAGVSELGKSLELTPQLMNLFGQLLRESTQGTLDLLHARMLTKKEMRAEMTMIAPKENNPLKFSPTVETALAHLITPQGQGFMTPIRAVKDAYDDLRSHQFGFMAGMRAALSGVLDRFNPVRLEQRLTQKTLIDSFIPSNRRAKLWSLFAERYSTISQEAQEDFHVLFGKEFLRAYEAQIARLGKEDQKYL